MDFEKNQFNNILCILVFNNYKYKAIFKRPISNNN